jgi:hypothetical protein
MELYIFQKGLPEEITNKGIVVMNGQILAWPYEETKEILAWLDQNQYVPRYIFTHLTRFQHPIPSSRYIGDRMKTIEENVKENLVKFSNFIDDNNIKLGGNVLYVIYFQSLSNMDSVQKEFLNRSVIQGGEYLLRPYDAIDFVERCKELTLRILALEAFILYDNGGIQPDMGADMYYDDNYYSEIGAETYLAEYHINKNTDIGRWEEAKQFLKEKISSKYYYQVDYDP